MRKPSLPKWMYQAFLLAEGLGQEDRPSGRKKIHKRLLVEQLEDRTLLDGGLLQMLSPANPAVSQSDGAGASAPQANANGRYIVYESNASNLVPGQVQSAAFRNVFLYDVQAGTTTLVSHLAGNPTTTGDAASMAPRISGDGRYVTYTSLATDLVAGQTGPRGVKNVFLYDRTTGINALVSHQGGSAATTTGGDGDSDVSNTDGFGFSNNSGQFLVYISRAIDLVPVQISSSHANVYLYSVANGTSRLVSHSPPSFGPGTGGNEDAQSASISQNGNLIAYDDLATNLVANQGGKNGNVFLYNSNADANILVSGVSGSPASGAGSSSLPHISADGSTIVYQSSAANIIRGQGPTNGFTNLYRYIVASGTTVLVSGLNGSPNTPSLATTDVFDVSADGTSVVFRSDATNLAPNQSGPAGNVFYYHASGATQAITLVSHVSGSNSVAAGGSLSAVDISDVSLSQDGNFVAYQSTAGNLLSGQTGPAGVLNGFLYDVSKNQNTLVSGSKGSATTGGAADSRGARLSPDGSSVVFISNASDLISSISKTNPGPDVFLYSRQSGSRLVSRSAFTAAGVSGVDSVSADGNLVVFTSNALNGVSGQVDSNFDQDVFVLNRTTGAVSLVSHIPGSPITTGNAGSPNTTSPVPFLPGSPGVPAVISADGTYIAFVSSATNLVANQPNQSAGAFENVFLYEVATGKVTLVSRTTYSPTNSFLYSFHPVISADGRYVAYVSLATDLVSGQASSATGYKANIFLYDRINGTTALVSGSSSTTTGNDSSTNPSMSDDGSLIAYESQATNLVSGLTVMPESNIYLFNRATGKNILVSHVYSSMGTSASGSSNSVVISANGAFLAFVSFATDLVPSQSGAAGFSNVFRYNVATLTTNLVSGLNDSPTQTASGNSDSPAISVDGASVAFRSDAPNLVAGQTGPQGSNIFLFSQPANSNPTLTLISHAAGAATTTAGGNSTSPSIDGDASLVAYLSTANNLVSGQSGGGINNVFGWARQLSINFLISGQNASPTMISQVPASMPIVSRDPVVVFNVSGSLMGNSPGTINAIANKLLDVSLTPAPFTAGADGSLPPNTQLGTLKTVSGLLSQVVLPSYVLPTGSMYPADNALFMTGVVQSDGSVKLIKNNVPVNLSSKSSFSIIVLDTIAQFSINAIYTLAVSQASTSVVVSSTSVTSVYGQPVSFAATVASQGSPVVSSGTVTFKDGNTVLGVPVPVGPSGQASLTITAPALLAGQHTITAYYNGTSLFAASSSAALTQTVSKASTTTAVSSSDNPSVFGQSVIFTATIGVQSPGAGTPSGMVQFMIDGVNIGSPVSLSGAGTASFTTGFYVNTHTVSATYLGDANFSSSNASLTQTVAKAATSTAVSSSANPSVFGQSVTFIASVSVMNPGSTAVANPTGAVQFTIDGVNAGSPIPVSSSGSASFTTGFYVNTHTVSATYLGDANFSSSNASLTETVAKAATSTAVSSSANPSVFGQSVTFTASVSVLSPGSTAVANPAGTVQFIIDGVNAGSPINLSSGGTATFTTGFFVNTHSVGATYQGDANFSSSSGTLVGGQTVNQASTATLLTSTPNPSQSGQSVTFTASISVLSPGSTAVANPTGAITFLDTTAGTPLGSAVLAGSNNGVVSITASILPVGTHSITASYSGDGNFSSSSGILAGGQTVQSATSVVTWINSAGGGWDTASNWIDNNNVNRVPTAGDDVVINIPGITVTHGLTQADALHSLATQDPIILSSGSLTIGGPSQINAAFTVSGGTLILNGASLDGSGTLLNQGTLEAQGNSAIDISLSTGSTSIIGLQAANTALTIANSFTNNGLIERNGTGAATLGIASGMLSNNGTIAISAGSMLSLSGLLANLNSGTLSGGTYDIAGTFQFPQAAIATNAATIVLDGPGAKIIDQSMNNALAGFANNAASGSFTVQDGQTFATAAAVPFSNAGTLIIEANSAFAVTGILSNYSGTTLTGGTYDIVGGTFQFMGANVVTNAASIALDGTSAQIVDQANNNALTNFAANAVAGNLFLYDGASLTVGAFANAGYLGIGYPCRFTVTGAYSQSAAGSVRSFGTLELAGGGSANGTVINAGSLVIGAGTVFAVPGTFSNEDASTNTAGVLTVDAGGLLSVTGAFADFDAASMTLSDGTYLISGTMQAYADIRTNAAAIMLDGAGQIVNLATNSSALADFGNNQGSFRFQDGALFTAGGDFSNAGNLEVAAGSAITVPASGTFTNDGFLAVESGGTLTAAGAFANFDPSSMTLTGGTYLLGGMMQAYADIQTNAATIVLDGAGQFVNLTTNNSALLNLAANTGGFMLQNGASFTAAGDFSNAGNLEVGLGSTFTLPASGSFRNNGFLAVGTGGTFTVMGTFANFDTNSGSLTSGSYDISGVMQVYADILTNSAALVLDGSGQMVNLATGNSALVNLATNAGGGSLTIQDGAQFSTAGDLMNTGSLTLDDGSVLVNGSFSNSGSVALLNGSLLQSSGGYTQSSGSTILNNATLSISGLVDLQGGVLSGAGTIQGSVRNAGEIDVGGNGRAGLLSISGDYTQAASGTLSIAIGGSNAGTDFGQLTLGGTATLGGTFNVSLIDGFEPALGETFQVLTFGSHSGDFASENGLDLGGGLHLAPQYGASSLSLVAVGGGNAALPGGRTNSPGNRQPAAGDTVRMDVRLAGMGPADYLPEHSKAHRPSVDALFSLFGKAAGK